MLTLKTIVTAWRNKKQILEGVSNSIIVKKAVEHVAEARLGVCRTNECAHYDKDGSSPKAVFPGIESCAACGCSLHLKTRAMSADCGLTAINLEPMWVAEISEDDEDKINTLE